MSGGLYKEKFISVAMATYNGAKYLGPQLDSIIAQTRLPDEMVIGDDASTDGTLGMLRDFQRVAPFEVRIVQNAVRKGFAENFLSVTGSCAGEWIMFADQDDVWLPDKIERAAKCAEMAGNSLMMIVQSSEITDSDLTPSGRYRPSIRKSAVERRNSHYGFWVVPGFCQTVRGDILREFDWSCRPTNYFRGHRWQSHDKWSCMLANALGEVAYIPGRSAFYRRHESAETGTYAASSVAASVALSMSVGADEYRFLENVAHESAICLKYIAGKTNREIWRCNLEEGARYFERMGGVFSARADIYEKSSFFGRAKAFYNVVMRGGYFGSRFVRMPVLSLFKDIHRVLLGWR